MDYGDLWEGARLVVPIRREVGDASDMHELTEDAWSCDPVVVGGTTGGVGLAKGVEDGVSTAAAIEVYAAVFCMDSETGIVSDLALIAAGSTA